MRRKRHHRKPLAQHGRRHHGRFGHADDRQVEQFARGNQPRIAKGGDDVINGGDGDDVIDGGFGSDVIDGGAGDDTLISRSDAGEQRSGQLAIEQVTRGDPDGEVDDALQKLSVYANQPLVADDVMIGGEGNDGFVGYAGNDVIDGGAGYNQVDYVGNSYDYTAGIADDGTIIVVKPNDEGTDAMVNIDGIYFAGDDVWTPVSDLGPIGSGDEQPVDDHPGDDGGDDTPVFECPGMDDGGAGNGEAYGTDGFDIMYEDGNSYVYAGGSADLIFAGSGDAVLEGGEGFDVMHANGASTDYTFEANDDGSVTAYSAMDGTDTLVDMEAVYFAGDDQFEMMSSLTGGCPAEVEVEVDPCH